MNAAIFEGKERYILVVAGIVCVAVLPLTTTDYLLSILTYGGIAAIGAVGLNLLTGYAGQVSLGQACFLGVGAYTAAYLGSGLGLPVAVWLVGATALQQYQATKGQVVMYADVLGTPIVSALLPALKRDGIVAVPGSIDAAWLREQNLMPWGTPNQAQVVGLLKWKDQQKGGVGTLCTMVQDDPYGASVQEGTEQAARELETSISTRTKFLPTDTAFGAQISQLRGIHLTGGVQISRSPGSLGWGSLQAGRLPTGAGRSRRSLLGLRVQD